MKPFIAASLMAAAFLAPQAALAEGFYIDFSSVKAPVCNDTFSPTSTAGPLALACGPYTALQSEASGLRVFTEGYGLRLTSPVGFGINRITFGKTFGQYADPVYIEATTVDNIASTSMFSTDINNSITYNVTFDNLQSIRFYSSISNFRLDNVVGTIPEPQSWLMILAGFALIGGTLRYRRRATGAVIA